MTGQERDDLARLLYERASGTWDPEDPCTEWARNVYREDADAILASDWLRERDQRIKREVLSSLPRGTSRDRVRLDKALADVERLTAERDEALARIEAAKKARIAGLGRPWWETVYGMDRALDGEVEA